MRDAIHQFVWAINRGGEIYWSFAGTMFVQVVLLTASLLCLDLLLRHKVRAVVRYWIWLLVLAKLLLPTSVGTPASLAYWLPVCETALSNAPAGQASGMAADRGLAPPDFPSLPAIATTDEPATASPVAAPPAENAAPPLPAPQPGIVRSPGEPATVKQLNVHWQGLAFGAWILAVVGLLGLKQASAEG